MPQQEEVVRQVASHIKGFVDQESVLNFDNLAGPASRIEKRCREVTKDEKKKPMQGLHAANECLSKHLFGQNDRKQRVGIIKQALTLLKSEANQPASARRTRTEPLADEQENLMDFLGVPAGSRR